MTAIPTRLVQLSIGAVGIALVVGGCPSAAPLDAVGLTAGGTKDIAEARAQIDSGRVPDPNAITVEGFMAEHEIPIEQPADAPEFYAAFGTAYRVPFDEPAPMGEVYVGLGTTIDINAFRRTPLNLAVVIDVSRSMQDSAQEPDDPNYNYYYAGAGFFDYLFGFEPPEVVTPVGERKIDSVKLALSRLIEHLTVDDQVTIFTFNDGVTQILETTGAGDVARVRRSLDKIETGGATNIHKALRTAYEQLIKTGRDGLQSRVILLTDAQPNVEPTGSVEFIPLVEQYANEGIGLTLLGVGWEFGSDLARQLSSVRGANSVYLSTNERIAAVFDQDFDFLVTPAAYDLTLDINIASGIGVRDVYGVPDYYANGGQTARVSVPTLFFSRREGGSAIVVRLTTATPPDFSVAVDFGSVDLSFVLPDGTVRRQTQALTLPTGIESDGDPAYFSSDGVRRAALLLDTARVMKRATLLGWSGNRQAGGQLITDFLVRYDTETLGMSDRLDETSRSLQDERTLLTKLQGAIFGGYYYWN